MNLKGFRMWPNGVINPPKILSASHLGFLKPVFLSSHRGIIVSLGETTTAVWISLLFSGYFRDCRGNLSEKGLDRDL